MPGRALDGGDDDLEATARGSVAVDEGSGSGRSGRPRWGLFFGLAASIVVAD